jgi:hypothetical protein
VRTPADAAELALAYALTEAAAAKDWTTVRALADALTARRGQP